MYNNNTPYISEHYTKMDYLNLHLSYNSNEATFDSAIRMFVDRIESRFTNQIHTLSSDCNLNGFSIMALECLLIETFAQFKNGLDDTQGASKAVYTAFLRNDLQCFASQNIANAFYSNIRCGILHQAQTKPGSGLTFGMSKAIDYRQGFLMVSVDRFIEEMDSYFAEYCRRLHNRSEVLLRQNFIQKMDFICHR